MARLKVTGFDDLSAFLDDAVNEIIAEEKAKIIKEETLKAEKEDRHKVIMDNANQE